MEWRFDMQHHEKVDICFDVNFDKLCKYSVFPDRITPVIELARNKRVLNIGCCGSDALISLSPVHDDLAKVSSFCLGIDIFEEGIKKFQEMGKNVLLANAETFDLGTELFDLAVLGDIIEHVSNPGMVFDRVNKHLINDGLLVLTTPNPFGLSRMLRMMLFNSYNVNREHVSWFDPCLLSFLLERSGFKAEEIFWVDSGRNPVIKLACKVRKSFHSTFGIIARKK